MEYYSATKKEWSPDLCNNIEIHSSPEAGGALQTGLLGWAMLTPGYFAIELSPADLDKSRGASPSLQTGRGFWGGHSLPEPTHKGEPQNPGATGPNIRTQRSSSIWGLGGWLVPSV
jgi:hypothetical protein